MRTKRGSLLATTRTRHCSPYWPSQSAPASQVTFVAVGVAVTATLPTAEPKMKLCAGTAQFVPESLETRMNTLPEAALGSLIVERSAPSLAPARWEAVAPVITGGEAAGAGTAARVKLVKRAKQVECFGRARAPVCLDEGLRLAFRRQS